MSIEPTLLADGEFRPSDTPEFWDQPVTICGKTATLETWTGLSEIAPRTIERRVTRYNLCPVDALTRPDQYDNCLEPEDVLGKEIQSHFANRLSADPRFHELIALGGQLPGYPRVDLVDLIVLPLQIQDLRSHCRNVADVVTDASSQIAAQAGVPLSQVSALYHLAASLAADHVADFPQRFPELPGPFLLAGYSSVLDFGLATFFHLLAEGVTPCPNPLPSAAVDCRSPGST